jgi:hypothetical protein
MFTTKYLRISTSFKSSARICVVPICRKCGKLASSSCIRIVIIRYVCVSHDLPAWVLSGLIFKVFFNEQCKADLFRHVLRPVISAAKMATRRRGSSMVLISILREKHKKAIHYGKKSWYLVSLLFRLQPPETRTQTLNFFLVLQ